LIGRSYASAFPRVLRQVVHHRGAESLDNTGNSAKVRRKVFESSIQSAGAMVMKNVYEVLRQKEMELTRLEKEVEALRLVAPLLSEEKEMMSDMGKPALATAVNGPQATARLTVPAPPSMPAPQPVRAAGWDDTAKRWP
jgi:hypothetical protein